MTKKKKPAADRPVNGFRRLAAAWYGAVNLEGRIDRAVDEITAGAYYADGSGEGDFCIRWFRSGKHLPSAELSVSHDSFSLFKQTDYKTFLARLLNSKNPQPAAVVKMLVECGFKDLTERKRL